MPIQLQSTPDKITLKAGGAISQFQTVILNAANQAVAASSNTLTPVYAISLQTLALNAIGAFLVRGEITNTAWAFTPGKEVYIDTNGNPTQTQPTTGNLQVIAIAKTATKIYFYPSTQIPQIVANIILLGQTASIGTTAILTPPTNGLYRISAYLVTTTAGTAGTVLATLSWTDDAQAQTAATATIDLTVLGSKTTFPPLYIRAKTTAAISYATTVAGATGNPQYAFFLTLERLF